MSKGTVKTFKVYVSFVGTRRMIAEDVQEFGSLVTVVQVPVNTEEQLIALHDWLQRRGGYERLTIIYWRELEA